jgi:FkbM family methyltransferase
VRTALRLLTSLLRRRVPGLEHTLIPYDKGRSRMAVDLRSVLGLHLYRYPYEDPELELCISLLDAGDLFVDGGANVGLFSLAAAARVGNAGKILSFEPARATRERLVRNVSLNRLSWVEVRAEALADRAGDVELTVFDIDRDGLSSFAPSLGGGRKERVRAVALDTLLSAGEAARLRVIKLDLEGAELSALRGARGLLAQHGPDVFVEVVPEHLARQGATAEALFDLLLGHGYRLFQAASSGQGPASLVPLEDSDLAAWRSGNVIATRRIDSLVARGMRCVERGSAAKAAAHHEVREHHQRDDLQRAHGRVPRLEGSE